MPINPDDKEAKVKEYVKRVLRDAGAYYFMPATGGFGKSGVPDFVGCHMGIFFGVECKSPSRATQVSALQLREGKKIMEAKGHWFVVTNEETLALFKLWLDERI